MNGDNNIWNDLKIQEFNTSTQDLVQFRSAWAPLLGDKPTIVLGKVNTSIEVKTVDLLKETVDPTLILGTETELNHFKGEDNKFEYTRKTRASKFINADASKQDLTRIGVQAVDVLTRSWEREIGRNMEGRIHELPEVTVTSALGLYDAINSGYAKFVKLQEEAGFEVAEGSIKFITDLDTNTALNTIIDQTTTVKDILKKTFGDTYINTVTYRRDFQNKDEVVSGVYFINRYNTELFMGETPRLSTTGRNDEGAYDWYKFGYDIPAVRTEKDTDTAVMFLPLDISALMS